MASSSSSGGVTAASLGVDTTALPIYERNEILLGQVPPTHRDRPARVQVEQRRQLQAAEHAGDYNIWYHRYAGERNYEKAGKASTRVVLETDVGLTRADYTNPGAYICLHFARGCCVYGKECSYRHCAPTEEDETQMDAPRDCFGRDRHGSFRDDMGGTGTWNKECKTLYIGRLCATPPEERIVETLARHFGEFGLIDSLRALKSKGCGFVTFRMRCTAEFAKEAMAEQSLDNDEQVNIRWAYDDPNPRAQAARLRNNARLMLDAMERRGDLHDPNDEPYAKRQRGDGDDGDGDGDGDDGGRISGWVQAPIPRTQESNIPFGHLPSLR